MNLKTLKLCKTRAQKCSKIYWYNQNNKRYSIIRRTYDLFGDLILIQEWVGQAERVVK